MYPDLKGRSVLVTGASRGIGLAIAQSFAGEGCDVHMVARDAALLSAEAKKIAESAGVRVTPHAHDLADPDSIGLLVQACRDVDILVNNAGAIPFGDLEEVEPAAWRHSWDLKVFGYIDMTRQFLPRMLKSGRGVIVNVIGSAALRPNPRYIAGCTANAALDMFTRCVGAETLRRGVRIVAVHPGPILSDRLKKELRERARKKHGDPERWAELLDSMTPAERPGMPADVAKTVLFLASEQAAYISGSALRVDAGRI